MEDTFDADPDRHAPDPFDLDGPILHEQYHDVPGDPNDDPEGVIDGYAIHVYGDTGAVPRQVYVVEHLDDEDVYSRLWAFGGFEGIMALTGYYRHRYGSRDEAPPDSNAHDCCFKIERDHGLRENHCPDAVVDVVVRVTDAPLIFPNDDRENGHDEEVR